MSDIDNQIKNAELRKLELENQELEYQIGAHETGIRRTARLATSILVPIITASIALGAAYLELRKVRDERAQLNAERREFQRLREEDYVDLKRDELLRLLSNPNSDLTSEAALSVLADILTVADRDDEQVALAVFPYALSDNREIRNVAAGILAKHESPIVGQNVASALQTATESRRVVLLELAQGLRPENGAGALGQLLMHGDAVVAGTAMVVLARDEENLAELLIDYAESEDTNFQNAVLHTVILGFEKLQTSDLRHLVSDLLSPTEYSSRSVNLGGICFVREAGIPAQKLGIFERQLQNTNIHLTNRIILADLLGKTEFLQMTLEKPDELLSANYHTIESIYSAHNLNIPKWSWKDIETDLADRSEVDPKILAWIDVSSIPVATLVNWLSLEESRHLVLTARRELIKRWRNQEIPNLPEDIGEERIRDQMYLKFAGSSDPAQISEAVERVIRLLNEKEGSFWEFRATELLNELSENDFDVSQLLAEFRKADAFQFYASLGRFNEESRAAVIKIMKRDLASGEIDDVQAAALAIDAGLTNFFQDSIKRSVDEGITQWQEVEKSRILQNPDYFKGEAVLPILLVSAISDVEYYEEAYRKVAKSIFESPMVPREGVSFTVDFDRGSFGVSLSSMKSLISRTRPDFSDRLEMMACNGHEVQVSLEGPKLSVLISDFFWDGRDTI